jgi:hypothetical protein
MAAGLLMLLAGIPMGFVPDAALCSNTPACKGSQGFCCPTVSGRMLECCTDAVTAMPKFELPKSLNGTDWCMHSKRVSVFLDSLTLTAAESVLRNVTSGEYFAGGGANVAIGAALLFAPIVLGPTWPTYLMSILSSLLGAIVANKLFKTSEWLIGDDRTDCAAGLILVLLLAFGLGVVSLCAASYAFFAMGAAIGGFAAYHAAGLVVPMLADTHDIGVGEKYVNLGVALCALACGLYLSSARDGVIDTTAGVVGALLCAEGILVLVGTNEDLAEQIQLYKYFRYVALKSCPQRARGFGMPWRARVMP